MSSNDQPPESRSSPGFRWYPSLVGGMAAIGSSAIFGTLVSNVSLWLSMPEGLTPEQAYARFAHEWSASTELVSFGVVLLSGLFGGYVSALYGSGRHLIQASAAGVVSAAFFIVMMVGPLNPPVAGWYAAVQLAGAFLSSLAGGYLYAARQRARR